MQFKVLAKPWPLSPGCWQCLKSGPWYLNCQLFFSEEITLLNRVDHLLCHLGFALSPEGPGQKHHHILGSFWACSWFPKSPQKDSIFSAPRGVPPSYLSDSISFPSCLTFRFGLFFLFFSCFLLMVPRFAVTNSHFRKLLHFKSTSVSIYFYFALSLSC